MADPCRPAQITSGYWGAAAIVKRGAARRRRPRTG